MCIRDRNKLLSVPKFPNIAEIDLRLKVICFSKELLNTFSRGFFGLNMMETLFSLNNFNEVDIRTMKFLLCTSLKKNCNRDSFWRSS